MNEKRKKIAAVLFGILAMAITFIAQANNSSTAANAIIVNKPANTAENDLMIAYIFIEDNTDRIGSGGSVPTGWQNIINATTGNRAIRQYVYWKIANNAEPANYSWGMNANDEIIGIIATFRGADQSSPIGNKSTSTDTGSSVNHTAPAITIGANGRFAIQVSGTAYGTNYTGTPANYTKIADRATGANNANRITAAFFYSEVNAGNTGNVTATSANADYYIASLIELKLPSYNISTTPASYLWRTEGVNLSYGYIPKNYSISVEPISYIWRGVDSVRDFSIAPAIKSYLWRTEPQNLRANRVISTSPKSYFWMAEPVALKSGRKISIDDKAYLWRTEPAGIRINRKLTISSGEIASYLWKTEAINFAYGQPASYKLSIDPASYIWRTEDIRLEFDPYVIVSPASYIWRAVDSLRSFSLSPESKNYIWKTEDVNLIYAQAGQNYTLEVNPASHVWRTENVDLRMDRRIIISPQSYVWRIYFEEGGNIVILSPINSVILAPIIGVRI